LPSGFIITRAVKHEPIDLDRLSADELKRQTDKVRGSKFTSAWSLRRLVDWIERQTVEQQLPFGKPALRKVRFKQVVGYSLGKKVYTIAIRSDGRHVHAYPDKDS